MTVRFFRKQLSSAVMVSYDNRVDLIYTAVLTFVRRQSDFIIKSKSNYYEVVLRKITNIKLYENYISSF